MLHRGLLAPLLALASAWAGAAGPAGTDAGLPHLEKRGAATQLVVDGAPVLLLGGELHNSSASSLRYLEPVWPRLAAMHLNTVLAPVAWETIEPQEGRFDFGTVDGLLDGARRQHLRLVILWFGAWKNTFSTYAPAWVKTDPERFARVRMRDGRGTDRLSPFSANVRDADARAFARLLHHLRDVDARTHTVLMMQVENEVGVIPESRDHAPAAESAFAAAVPASLLHYLQQHRATLHPQLRAAWEGAGAKSAGSWHELFGATPLTDDLFMAWQYASAIEQVAAAGKREYPLPMYANAALVRPNYVAGQYNSGGPLPHSIDVWHAAAPSLDFLSPDVYFNEFAQWASQYARPDNPLFIPEAQGGATAAANALYAFGHLAAVGFSPFGIDDDDAPAGAPLRAAYGVLAQLAPLVLEGQRTGRVDAALIEGSEQRAARVELGDFTATVVPAAGSANDRIGVLFIRNSPSEFLVAGSGDARVTFSTGTAGPPLVGIESIDEQFFENGAWTTGRRLNGDESSQGQALRLQGADLSQGRIYRVRLYRYR